MAIVDDDRHGVARGRAGDKVLGDAEVAGELELTLGRGLETVHLGELVEARGLLDGLRRNLLDACIRLPRVLAAEEEAAVVDYGLEAHVHEDRGLGLGLLRRGQESALEVLDAAVLAVEARLLDGDGVAHLILAACRRDELNLVVREELLDFLRGLGIQVDR